jgi:flagella basal body P-ring formation protein FlgA
MRALGLFLAGALLWAGPAAPVGTAEPVGPVVERLQRDALAYVEAQAAGLPGAFVFRVVKPPLLPRSTGELVFEPDHLSKRDLGGRFFASFKASVDGRPLGQVRVDLEGKWTGKLLRTRVSLPRKAVPEEGQLEEMTFEGTPPVGALAELPAGYRLRGAQPPGHILTQGDLEAIPVILAGDRVRLEVVSGDLTVAVETQARSNGAVGEKIRLELPTSRKAIQGVVVGPGEARAQWAGAK